MLNPDGDPSVVGFPPAHPPIHAFLGAPIGIPAWLYAIGFMLYSFYGMKEAKGNIGHDAHLGGAIIGLLITAALVPQSVRENLSIFLIVLVGGIGLLVYLWVNPLFLPLGSFLGCLSFKRKGRAAGFPEYKRQKVEVDAILDKIAKRGIDSLTSEEKRLLGEVSGKYRRQAESKKPDSGLAI